MANVFGNEVMHSVLEPHLVSSYFTIPVLLCKRYGDGAGNTVEENSSIFSIIQMR